MVIDIDIVGIDIVDHVSNKEGTKFWRNQFPLTFLWGRFIQSLIGCYDICLIFKLSFSENWHAISIIQNGKFHIISDWLFIYRLFQILRIGLHGWGLDKYPLPYCTEMKRNFFMKFWGRASTGQKSFPWNLM